MSGDTTVTFHSPTDNLTLVVKAATRKMNDAGQWDTVPGERIQFKNGRLVVSDARTLAFLRGHENYGRLFHEQGAERDRGRDNSSAMVAHVMDLALAGDSAAIADLLVAERNSYSRPEVLAACEKALERIGAAVPAPPAPPEHQLERVRTPGAVGPSPVGFDGSERPTTVGPNAGDPAIPVPPELVGAGQAGPPAPPPQPTVQQ